MAKGIELAGAVHKGFVEWNADACRTLKANYPEEIVHETDIRNFKFSDFEGVDIIAGGPPCQPFSIGGKAKGYDDERDMFPYAISAIRQLMPKAFIFENVRGLLRKSFREYFRYIILQLSYPEVHLRDDNWKRNLSVLESVDKDAGYKGLKYNVSYKMVNAADYGVPQRRERVIIVGVRSDLNVSWNFPKETHSEDALLWDKYVSMDYWSRHSISPDTHFSSTIRTERERLVKRYGMFKPDSLPWVTVRDALSGLAHPSETKNTNHEHQLRKGAREYPGHTGSELDMPSKTLKAGDHGVPGGENMIRYSDGTCRYYTVLEAKRIQTFPDDYPITGSWTEAMRQLGNAVPVKLAYVIASSLFEKIF